MNAVTELPSVEPVPTVTGRRVTWRDHAWLTWHRQGGALLAVVVLMLGLTALLLFADQALEGAMKCRGDGACFLAQSDDAKKFGEVLLRIVSFVPLVFALFLGVPTVAREFEARTTVLAWSQDVSARRWLAGRLAVLVAATVALSGAVSWAAARVARALHDPPPSPPSPKYADVTPHAGFVSEFDMRPFELMAPMTVVYSVAGLLLGVAVGALLRHTLAAVAAVTVLLVSLRLAVAAWWRPRFMEPERLLQDPRNIYGTKDDGYEYLSPPPDSLVIDEFGWLTGDGQKFHFSQCGTPGTKADDAAFEKCVVEGGHQIYSTFQPPSRLDPFRWIEFGVYAVVAVAAVALTFAVLRGARLWSR